MTNPAATDHPVHDLIRERWSPRAFTDRSVDGADLASVMEAARWAPSCFNEQPWRFIVGIKGEADNHARVLDCLVPGNQEWAQSAPVLMISAASTTFARNDNVNRHGWHDVGLASAQLVLQATALGLSVHFMAGFSPDKARQTFAIPEGFDPVAAIALGYVDGGGDARARKGLDETVFAGTWGTAAALG